MLDLFVCVSLLRAIINAWGDGIKGEKECDGMLNLTYKVNCWGDTYNSDFIYLFREQLNLIQ